MWGQNCTNELQLITQGNLSFKLEKFPEPEAKAATIKLEVGRPNKRRCENGGVIVVDLLPP